MIDKKLQEYYESRFSMMSTQGWQDLVEDAQNMFNSLNHVLSIQSEADLMVKKGQLDLLQWLNLGLVYFDYQRAPVLFFLFSILTHFLSYYYVLRFIFA